MNNLSIATRAFLVPAVSIAILLAFGSVALGGLVHSYDFEPDAPLADGVGGLSLEKVDVVASQAGEDASGDAAMVNNSVGTTGVTFDPEGFATFDGGVNSLAAVLDGSVGSPFRVSFWFRLADAASSPHEAGVLAVTGDPSYGKGLWEVELKQGMLRFDGKTNERALVKTKLIEKTEAGAWYFVTLQFDDAGKTGFWINDGPFTGFVDPDPSADPSIAFSPPPTFHIGNNRTRSLGFAGDIGSVRIFNDTDWDDAKQADAYAAGPAAPTAP